MRSVYKPYFKSMTKRPHSEPSTIPAATGGDAGDSTDCTDTGDAGGSASTDPLRALAADVKKFETDPKTFIEALDLPVHSNIRFQIKWFKKLVKAWRKTPPATPLAATRLLFNVIKEVRPARIDLGDLEGIMQHYGLPQYTDVLQEDWEASQDKDAPKSAEEEQFEKLCASAPFTWSDEEELYKWDDPPSRKFTWSDKDLQPSDGFVVHVKTRDKDAPKSAVRDKDAPKSAEEEQYEKLCASAPFTWSDEEELYKWDGPTIFTWSDKDLLPSDGE